MTSTQDEQLRALADEAAKATVPIDSPNYSAEKWFIARDAALFALASLPAPDTALPDIGPDPFKGPREDYTLTNVEKRLRDAYTVQQKGVPDQTALVWRCDLLKLFHELPRLRSIEEDWREMRAMPDTAGEVVAWRYAPPEDGKCHPSEFYSPAKIRKICPVGWTETPLYAAPQAPATGEVQAIIAWLRKHPTRSRWEDVQDHFNLAADAIERGDYLATLTGDTEGGETGLRPIPL